MSEAKECRKAFEKEFCGNSLVLSARANEGFYINPRTEDRWKVWQVAWSRAAKPAVPEVLFDGYAVLQAMSEKAKARTSPENVSDVLDAAVKLIRIAAPTPPAAPKEPT